MPAQETIYKIFIASPSGLNTERKAFAEIIDEYNKSDAQHRGVSFRAVGWEDTLPSMGRPQKLINEELEQCDFFILLLHNRWGSNPGKNLQNATSGTEEEFRLARKCYDNENAHMKQIVCAFKSVCPEQLADPGKQLEKVLEFKKELEESKELLYSSFFSVDEFKSIIRKQLGRWLLNHENEAKRDEKIQNDPPIVPKIMISMYEEEIIVTTAKKDAEEIIKKAWELAENGKLTEAEIEFSKAIIYKPNPYKLLNYARFLKDIGQLDKSLMMLNEVLKDSKINDKDKSSTFSLKGKILGTRGNFEEAKVMHEKSLEINKSLGLHERMNDNYSNIGDIMKICGDLDEADIVFKKGLKISKENNFIKGIASQYSNLGNVLAKRGDLESAEVKYGKSLKIYKELDNSKGVATVFLNLGILKKDKGNFLESKEMYEKSLAVFEKIGNLKGIATVYGNLGNMLRNKGDTEESKIMCKKSLEINKKLNYLQGMAANYGNLGMIYILNKKYEEAELYCRKALDINAKIGRVEGVSKQYGNLGDIKKLLRDYDGAEKMYKKSLAISQSKGYSMITDVTLKNLEELEKLRNK
jgi:tetratricopeptide (TPR) repeat protein